MAGLKNQFLVALSFLTIFKGGREKAPAVMKDSRSGALGVPGLVLLILFKYSLLVEISGSARYLSLFLMPVSGRLRKGKKSGG